MIMLNLSTVLLHYKRNDIQDRIVEEAQNKEVAVRLGDKGFGKRPEILMNSKDVIEFAKQGATSFHFSEELWYNPMNLSTEMKKQEIEKLRKGWDLVIDVDCKEWEYAKLIAHLIVQALKAHGIKSVSVKFSGNKGFHIGVPFEAFPETIHGKPSAQEFPDGVRRIASYLIHYITPQFSDYVEKDENLKKKLSELEKTKELMKTVCANCGKEKKKESIEIKILCPYCEAVNTINNEGYFKCSKCKKIIKIQPGEEKCSCGSARFVNKIDLMQIMDIDTILISSRHLYRSSYSLHEKSGLCSIPVNPELVLKFEKSMAKPPVKIGRFKFLDKSNVEPNEGLRLIVEAFDFKPKIEQEEFKEFKGMDIPEEAIPQELFPPCIKTILNGLDDGRKRAMFILTNFLQSCGWGKDQIENLMYEWNKRNKQELRQVLLQSHLKYHLKNRKAVLPPNCDNRMYYIDLQWCRPDALCKYIKNPVQYAKRKARGLQKQGNKDRAKLTEEQKEMRRKYRENMNKQK